MMKLNKKYKCVVFDLDHTLWQGILLENDEIVLREGIGNMLAELDRRGILMSIASKNEYAAAFQKLKELGIAEYFLYPQISWNPKSLSLTLIREKLNIGMDAIAFIDDQDYERAEVTHGCPEVDCFDVDVLDHLLESEAFSPRFITEESQVRRQMYLDDEKRSQDESQYGTVDIGFLKTQGMEFIISRARESDLQRMEELVHRTNQLNATGQIYSYEELSRLIASDQHRIYIAELKDKYGSYGKIGVCVIEEDGSAWTIRLLLMSCRVMSRGVGNVLLHYIINEALAHEKELFCTYKDTGKNRLMYITLKFCSFSEQREKDTLRCTLKKRIDLPDYLRLTVNEQVTT